MAITTVTETTYRAVYRYDGQEGGSYCVVRSTPALAWADADAVVGGQDPGLFAAGHWAVQITTTTTTTEDMTR